MSKNITLEQAASEKPIVQHTKNWDPNKQDVVYVAINVEDKQHYVFRTYRSVDAKNISDIHLGAGLVVFPIEDVRERYQILEVDRLGQ